MDITTYKQALEQGETLTFSMEKTKLLFPFFVCLILTIIGGGLLFKGEFPAILVGVALLLLCGYFTIMLGKSFLIHRLPKVISINKDTLMIYDLSIPALLGLKESFTLIPLHEILNSSIQTGRSTSYIVLQCTLTTVQNVQQHQKQVSGNLLRVYDIKNDLILLNLSPWLTISLTDLLALLQELHKTVTPTPQ